MESIVKPHPLAARTCCAFSTTAFSSVQGPGCFGGQLSFTDICHAMPRFSGRTSRRGATELIIKPCPLAARTCCAFSPTLFSSVASLHVSTTCDLLAQMSVGGRPLLHEHEAAVQTTTQPGSCLPPPGTCRSGAMEHCLFRFQVCLRPQLD